MGTFRSGAARLTLVAGLAIGALGASAGSAAAYAPSYWGYPGAVATPRIIGTTIDSVSGQVNFPSRTIWKSSRYAGYNQQACITYSVVYSGTSYSTSWSPYASKTVCGWISSSGSTNFPGFGVPVWAGAFIYSGNVKIQWFLSNGALVGQTILDYNNVNDYSCNCTIASSYSLGAYMLI